MGFDVLNLPDEWQKRRIREIGDVVTGRTPSTKCEEIAKPGNDFNISPSRYIHNGAGEEYRLLAEIAQELRDLEDEVMSTSKQLDKLFSTLGV